MLADWQVGAFLTVLGATIGAVSTAGTRCTNMGNEQLQRYVIGVHVSNIFESLLTLYALTFASCGIVLPLTSLRQIETAFIGIFLFGDNLSRRHVVGACLILSGIISTLALGPHDDIVVKSFDHLLVLLWRPSFVLWCLLLIVVGLVLVHVAFVAPERHVAGPQQVGDHVIEVSSSAIAAGSAGGPLFAIHSALGRKLLYLWRIPVGWSARRGSLAGVSGLCGGLALCSIEVVLEIFRDEGLTALWSRRFALVCVWLLCMGFLNAWMLHRALERYETNVVLPLYSSSLIMFAILSNIFLFNGESRPPMTDSIFTQLMFLLGIGGIVAGLFSMSHADAARELEELRQVTNDLLRVGDIEHSLAQFGLDNAQEMSPVSPGLALYEMGKMSPHLNQQRPEASRIGQGVEHYSKSFSEDRSAFLDSLMAEIQFMDQAEETPGGSSGVQEASPGGDGMTPEVEVVLQDDPMDGGPDIRVSKNKVTLVIKP